MDEYEAFKPIYLQIMEKIKSKIILGEIKPGERLLSLREMAVKMRVNPNTMMRVYNELEREGILETKRGSGSFVVEDSCLVKRLKAEFIETNILKTVQDLYDMGFNDKQIIEYVRKALKNIRR